MGVWNHQTTNFNQLQPTSTNFNQHTEFFLRSLHGHWLVTALLQSSLQVGVGLQGPSFDSKSREALDGYRASCCSDLSDCVTCFLKWGEQFAMLLYYAILLSLLLYTAIPEDGNFCRGFWTSRHLPRCFNAGLVTWRPQVQSRHQRAGAPPEIVAGRVRYLADSGRNCNIL